MKKSTKFHKENTVLFKVLASWCLYHQQLLMAMLKFLKEEQESCSQTCHSSAQSKSTEQVSRSPDTSLATCHICTNQKSTKSNKINEKIRQINLPYLTVCLKDLRFTWPNLNLGTVKLNLNKKKDVHLSDQLLYCINTRSKKKKKSVCYDCLSSPHSTSRRKLALSSSLSKLELQRTVTDLKRTMVKHGLQCRCTQPECRLEMTSKCCQTKADLSDENYMTVMNNVTFKESCCVSEQQNRLKPNRKDTRNNVLDSSTSSCVNFGSLIKHFLHSETNGFVELLNKKENCSKKNVQTQLYSNNEKMLIFDSSLSDCQTIDFARELNNLTDTFPKEKHNFVNSPNSIDDRITVFVEEQAQDILVLKDCGSTETQSDVQEKITHLPHDTLKIPSKNVNCIKNSQLCLPANLKYTAPQKIVNEKWRETKRHADQDVHVECAILPKRNSRNILGKCKLCDMSHGLCSFQNDRNLFCKCTIQKNSGILKNFKAEGLKFRNATEKNRNAHLKVVVERLEDSKLLANSTVNGKDICESNTNLCNSSTKASSYVFNVPQKTLYTVKQNCLNSALVAQTNCASVEETHEYVSKAATTSSDNSYFSPIKLMFVSKVESEDGVKYTLSSEYSPVNMHRDVKLSGNVVKTNPNHIQNRLGKNMAHPSPPKSKATAQNSRAKLLHYSDQSRFERKTSRRKKHACQFSKNIERSAESQHKKCSQKTFAEAGSDAANFSDKTAKRKKRPKLSKSRNAESYVVQNKGSCTQLRIKKVGRFLRSSERNLQILESDSLNFQRMSKRLKKLRKLSNVSGMCRTNETVSQEGGQGHLSLCTGAFTKYTEKEVNDSAEKDQKTIGKRKLTRSSFLIRKLKCSNHNTRSRKPLSTSSSSIPSSVFSVRSVLGHKSKKLHLNKCIVYKKRLRSYKQQCQLPLIDTKCTGNTDENRTANTDFRPNTVLKWWSASTSKESLLKDLENKYEEMANTWLGKDNREKDNEAQSLSALKFCSSETRSPVQMLFQKKCDIGDLAVWFMQTTETQSLSIGRKTNARSPLQKINRKPPRTKAKKPSINSYSSEKHFKKCAGPTPSETLPELLNVSKISNEKCKGGQNPNNLKNATDQNKEVCVKFACPGKHVDVTKACADKASTHFKASTTELAQSANTYLSAACQGAVTIPISIKHIDSLGSSKKPKTLVQNESESKPKTIYMCCSTKQNIRDCKVFLTKLGDVESKMSPAYGGSHSGNTIAVRKSKFKSEWKLKRSFTTKYCLQVNKSLARSPCTLSRIKNLTSKKCNFGMCLRKPKKPAAPYNSRSKSSILERQKRLSKMTLYVERNTQRSKPPIPNMGKIQREDPKFQLGPIKPVRIPAIRGLSSKGGTYSLTPIRIPLH